MNSFHDILFPLDIALHARGGPERRTEIVTLGSNRETRNARWARSRRRYEAGYGVKSLSDLAVLIAFFEERRGRLYGFRWRDRADHSSAPPGRAVSAADMVLGTGDGVRTAFQLAKTYGASFAPYVRDITRPVAGTVRIAVGGAEITVSHVAVDTTTGIVTFAPDSVPVAGTLVTAGFQFDVLARFDTDSIEIDHSGFDAGEIPHIPILEIMA